MQLTPDLAEIVELPLSKRTRPSIRYPEGIKLARLAAGMSHAQLAAEIDRRLGYGVLTSDNVRLWEQGVGIPTVDIFLVILAAAGAAGRDIAIALIDSVLE